ncbi:MAG TPA: 50S ribosomal protein L1 [Planctomycetota bacterium]|jgi:large subunit ribosomal protein L1|nr:50S ribosomal protein L1 [Planctomycetota bacterium]OQC19600.1 MAG: 50S ribosomal protein L1 [Planctomycetes bacterium ADurb.Bin069]NMD36631.1 50S ribosomal protein L1 [Planctomycetota bacterium]HNR99012.1 50S ribosomal protein L1 [Planctomycetota bacterium]HOE30235.1 50S ribosomal protein L1 [Planctomycetota bacterium]
MATRSKRYRAAAERRPAAQAVPVPEAVKMVKSFAKTKFDETVELVLRLNIDSKQSTQNVRGSFSLPHGIGRSARVIAFAEGEDAQKAAEAGAVEVGSAELVKKILDGWMEFDVAVAHPQMMKHVGRLGKVLGPQGKMPSPKSGTVTEDVARAVREFRAGKIEFRNDKGGNVQVPVGKRSFGEAQLAENITAMLEHVQTMRPGGVKGLFIQAAYLSSTMSPSVKLAV